MILPSPRAARPLTDRRTPMPSLRAAARLASVLLLAGTPFRDPLAAQPAADPRAALVVSTAWLAEHLKDPDLVLLHVGDRKEYDAGHLPGARFVSQNDVAVSNHDRAADSGLMLELPRPDSLRARLERLGVSDRSRVIVYYGGDWISPATRIVFTLDHAGLGARTSLLDGGMRAWAAERRPLSTEAPPAAAGKLSPLRTKPLVVDAAWVKARAAAPNASPNVRLIDGRAAVFYDGVEAGGPRRGHIPGARSLPFTDVAGDDLRFKSAAELTALFRKAGVAPGDTVVAYCHIGQQGTAVLFAARTLGHPVLLYDGSFQEWSRRADLPVENPAGEKDR
jgi:thiosulfate/3-mercaptopyruvate sulfurtransferase